MLYGAFSAISLFTASSLTPTLNNARFRTPFVLGTKSNSLKGPSSFRSSRLDDPQRTASGRRQRSARCTRARAHQAGSAGRAAPGTRTPHRAPASGERNASTPNKTSYGAKYSTKLLTYKCHSAQLKSQFSSSLQTRITSACQDIDL